MWSSANSLWHTFSRLKGGGQKEKLYPGLDAFSVLFSGFWCFFYLWANGARLVSNYWWPHLSTSGAAHQRLFWVQLRVHLANQPSLDIRPPFDFISFQSDPPRHLCFINIDLLGEEIKDCVHPKFSKTFDTHIDFVWFCVARNPSVEKIWPLEWRVLNHSKANTPIYAMKTFSAKENAIQGTTYIRKQSGHNYDGKKTEKIWWQWASLSNSIRLISPCWFVVSHSNCEGWIIVVRGQFKVVSRSSRIFFALPLQDPKRHY